MKKNGDVDGYIGCGWIYFRRFKHTAPSLFRKTTYKCVFSSPKRLRHNFIMQFESIIGEFDERISRKHKLEGQSLQLERATAEKQRSIKKLHLSLRALKDELADIGAEEEILINQINVTRAEIDIETSVKSSLVLELRNGKNKIVCCLETSATAHPMSISRQ